MNIGLVLAGGGARGAYQIGAWRALSELGLDKYIKGVSGTSIGALNALLFLEGNLEKAEELWLELSKEKIFPIGNIDLLKRGIFITLGNKNLKFVKKYMPSTLEQGDISREGLIEIFDKYVDFDAIGRDERSCYATCSELPDLKPRYFRLNDYTESEARDILLATSAIPMIYESREVDAFKYLDGAMSDNIPLQPLYGEGFDMIIVIHLSSDTFIDRYNFPKARIIEICPKDMPSKAISGTLDFSKATIKKRMKQGYMDTMYLIEPIIELGKYQREQRPKDTIVKIRKTLAEKTKAVFKPKKNDQDNINEDKNKISGQIS